MEVISGKRREWLIAHGDQPMEPNQQEQFVSLCEARRNGQPLAYLVGHREFYSRSFQVTPDVLIPRAESETLIRSALALAPQNARVLDMGTGSGALAITLVLERPDLTMTATDLSPEALQIAAANASTLGATVAWRQGNWFEPIAPGDRYELIVSNPPYIAADDQHLQQGDLRFEPSGALSSGPNGLEDIATIIAQAGSALVSGGVVLIEHGWQQAALVRDLFARAGYTHIDSERDDLGHERISMGQSPPD